MDIRATIVARRRERLIEEGPALGVTVPEKRMVPIHRFPAPPGIICEVKRRSPSRGAIDSSIDPFTHIEKYAAGGAGSVSILTEEDYFNGSLSDLIEAKRRFPTLSILRKDFLFDDADIDVSYRAGADAVLLIASILEPERLTGLYDRAVGSGLTPLVEIHDFRDLEKIAPIQPVCVGCNARNLETFGVDLLGPIELQSAIDWKCMTVFESGIWVPEHARIAANSGFDAILVGESVVRNPEIVSELINGFTVKSVDTFWSRLVGRKRPGRPLVKVCGITRESDLRLADALGADMLGFIFADSPRRVTADDVRAMPDTQAQKVAVVVTGNRRSLDHEIVDLVRSGDIDAVQFHGDETPSECTEVGIPYYKALRIGSKTDVDSIDGFYSPRVLLDSRVVGTRGGTGTTIDDSLVDTVDGPLWLAGGLAPSNIRKTIERHSPELVDVSSGLESCPGEKDPVRMKRFFSEILKQET